MKSNYKVSYEESQPNKLLVHKQRSFTTIVKAFEFSREIYLSGKSKGKPIIEGGKERAA